MKHRKTQARLDRRLKEFDDIKSDGTGNRKNSKWIRTKDGKLVMFHRPGSNKKPSPQGLGKR